MPRAFHIPGVALIFCAFLFNLLVSISLPWLPALHIVRTHWFGASTALSSVEDRLGIWGACYYLMDGDWGCVLSTQYRYAPLGTNSRWTNGLIVHPIAAGATFVSFLLSLFPHVTMMLLASLVSFFAAFVTLAAFVFDLVIYFLLKHELQFFGDEPQAYTGPEPILLRLFTGKFIHTFPFLLNVIYTPTLSAWSPLDRSGLWMTFVAALLLLAGGIVIIIGRTRDIRARWATTPAYSNPCSCAHQGPDAGTQPVSPPAEKDI